MWVKVPGILVASLGAALIVAVSRAPDAPGAPTTLPAGPTSRPADPADVSDDLAGLSRRIPELQLDSVPLEEAFRIIAERTKTNLSINWARLIDAGLPRTTPIKLHLWDVNLGQALTVVLTAACPPLTDRDGQPTPRFGYTVADNVITVSTVGSPRTTATLVYNVRDLIEMYSIASNETVVYPDDGLRHAEAPVTRGEGLEAVCVFITHSVSPESWEQNGGTGLIAGFGGLLVVRTTPENHRAIAARLQMLRDSDKKLPWTRLPVTRPAAQVDAAAARQRDGM